MRPPEFAEKVVYENIIQEALVQWHGPPGVTQEKKPGDRLNDLNLPGFEGVRETLTRAAITYWLAEVDDNFNFMMRVYNFTDEEKKTLHRKRDQKSETGLER